MKANTTIAGKITTLFPTILRGLGCSCIFFLAACSNDESVVPQEPEQQSVAISLAGGMPEENAVTRANLEDVLNNKTFTVWSYKNDAVSAGNYTSYQVVMPGYIVNYGANTAYTSTSNTKDWDYVGLGAAGDQEIKYWDFKAEAYRFFAYALGNATSPATPNAVTVANGTVSDAPSTTQVTFTSTVDGSTATTIDAAPYFTELWFSNDQANDYGKPVTLRFLKPFARVRFIFTFVEGLGFGRESLSKIKFCPTANTDDDDTNDQTIPTSGTVTVSYPLKGTATTESWATSGTSGINAFTIDYYAENTSVTPADSEPETYPNTPEKWYYVLPIASQDNYTIQVAAVTSDVKTAVVPAEYMSWNAGYEYTYKFKITEGGGIKLDIIQIGINDWVKKTPSYHTVYNW